MSKQLFAPKCDCPWSSRCCSMVVRLISGEKNGTEEIANLRARNSCLGLLNGSFEDDCNRLEENLTKLKHLIDQQTRGGGDTQKSAMSINKAKKKSEAKAKCEPGERSSTKGDGGFFLEQILENMKKVQQEQAGQIQLLTEQNRALYKLIVTIDDKIDDHHSEMINRQWHQ